MTQSLFRIHSIAGYQYIDEGPRSDTPPVVLLHGMLGDVMNWKGSIAGLASSGYRVLAPLLPVYSMPIKETSVTGLVMYVREFLKELGVDSASIAGNSLGGHVAALFAIRFPELVDSLILSGASGIEEVEMGSSTLRRRDRDYIRERAAITFFDPVHASDALVDEVFEIVNDRSKAVRLIKMARSVQNESVADLLDQIVTPTLLVWGKNDSITPPDVAKQFFRGIPDCRLHIVPECGHAPMIEHPERFNAYTLAFLQRTGSTSELGRTG